MKDILKIFTFFLGLAITPALAQLVVIPGQGMWAPGITEPTMPLGDALASAGQITSAQTSGKIAFTGTAWQSNPATGGCYSGTKNLQAVKFFTNNITNGSPIGTVRISVQPLSTIAGPPAQPSGTISGGGNGFATMALNTLSSNTWTQTPNFASSVATSCGQVFSIVFDWSSAGTGAVFQVQGSSSFLDPAGVVGPGISTTPDNVTWSPVAAMPDLLLVFDDGSFGVLSGTFAFSSVATRTYNSGSSPNEYGCSFQFPFQATVAGMATYVSVPSSAATMTMELTDDAGTPNVLATANLDGHQWANASNNWGYGYVAFTPVTLAKNTKYHIGAKATSGTSITLYEYTVGAAGEMAANPFGATFLEANRNGSNWSADTTTTRPGCQIMITQVNQ